MSESQEPVAHLWECIGRWSVYLVHNGKQADCAPPSWLVDAVNNATTPPQRTWVGLTDEQMLECNMDGDFMVDREIAKLNVQAKLRELNT
jgi:hypothetical protein